MTTSKFLKKLTAAEVGATKTHEVYIRMPNDFDYESFFNGSHSENGSVIEVNFAARVNSAIDPSLPESFYDLRFVYFANSNKEKRIPGLGSLFRAYNVKEGDVVCLERVEDDGNLSFNLTFLSPKKLQVLNGALLLNGDLSDIEKTEKGIKLKHPLQQIYYGAPGTGKSFTIDDVADDDNSVRTTFHPDTDYASFVGAYKPTMEAVHMSYVSDGNAKYAKPTNDHDGKENKIVYKYVPQAFLKAYTAAWKKYLSWKDGESKADYFLVIEEINRGNCAQIFGDLFQLLDRNNSGSSSYPISSDEDIRQYLKGFFQESPSGDHIEYLTVEERDAIRTFVLQKDNGKTSNIGNAILNGSKLLLPPNMHIWATMNTSDQSLFPIDSAFKRRWDWEYMPIVYSPKDKHTGQPIEWKFRVGDFLYSWGGFLEKINPQILTLTESSDKQMGYFFAKADPKTGIISENVFLNKVLFYLWTDVFKDYAIDSDIFKNPDTKKPLTFVDFYNNKALIGEFLKNLGVEPIEDAEVDIETIEDEDEDGNAVPPGKRQYYSINGKGKNNQRQTVLRALRSYVEQNPQLTAEEVLAKWETVNPNVPHFVESSANFNERITQYPDQHKRSWSVTVGDEKIYITNQWGAGRFGNFVELINNSNLGIKIEPSE